MEETNDHEGPAPDTETWLRIIQDGYSLLDDLEQKGFGCHPFSLGGGTVLMFDFKHRLSKDIDFFAYAVQWLSLLSPRLNEHAASLSLDYVEQANSTKIITKWGDIDFIVARDITSFSPTTRDVAGRRILVDPPSEILAKKLFYRAASFRARDVYDMSAVIDLAPETAAEATRAAISKRVPLLRRLDELADAGLATVLQEIVPYDGPLKHADRMIAKVKDFVLRHVEDVSR